jgi:hypothetical protein
MNGKVARAAVAVLAACGCSVQTLVTSEQSHAERVFALTANWPAFAQAPAGKFARGAVDILFMVDNSSLMAALQQQLAAGFAAFMTILDGLPGGAPDLHIGVVSSDMGAGDDSISGCNGQGGDRGRLQFAPRDGCMQANLDPDAHFIALRATPDGGRTANDSGASVAEVFGCIARLGQAGCGFEQPFSSVRHALDPALAPPENLGFLRREAFLAVVMVTNEDDCSASPGVPLFDTTSNRDIASQLGPLTNFRCNEFGHLCAGVHPPRTATGELTDCTSNETEGYLESVASFAAFLRGLKGDPAQVFVASIAGPPTPYQVHVRPPDIPDSADWPEIGPSCTTADGASADPAVRLNQLTESLGPYGRFEPICGDSMYTPLRRIAVLMTRPLRDACVARPSTPAICQVVDRWVDDNGLKHAALLPSCAQAPGATPCWSLADGNRSCGTTEQHLEIARGGALVPAGLMTAINCVSMPLPSD